MTPALQDAFIDNPEYLLALTFSGPDRGSTLHHSVTIDFSDTGVTAKVKRPRLESPTPRLLASKETIFAAVLPNQLIDERGSDFAESLVDRAVRFARSAARRPPGFQLFADSGESRRDRPPALDTSSFFSQLEAGSRNIEIAIAKTGDALTFLEQEGLAIDPAFTPDLMVLVGVIPVHFSVRTPKGQRIYKETGGLVSISIRVSV